MYACLVRFVKHFVVLRLVRQLFCILVIVDFWINLTNVWLFSTCFFVIYYSLG